MALPKRKHCSARRDKRRSHWKLTVRTLSNCPQCSRPVQPHRVCLACGFYRGRQVLAIKAKKASAAS